MLSIRGRKGIFSTATVWFADREFCDADIVYYKNCKVPVSQMCLGKGTIILELECQQKISFKGIPLDVRDVTMTFLCDDEITDEEIDRYIEFCSKALIERKKINARNLRKQLIKYRSAGGLVISCAYAGDTVYMYHLYIKDNMRAVLLTDDGGSNLTSTGYQEKLDCINWLLYCSDINRLKQIGCRIYDWGKVENFYAVCNTKEREGYFKGNYSLVYGGTDYKNPFLRCLYWYYIYFMTWKKNN